MECLIGDNDQGGVILSFSGGDIRISEHRKGGILSLTEASLVSEVLKVMIEAQEEAQTHGD